MSIFDNQIKMRQEHDRETIEHSLNQLSAAISGKKMYSEANGTAENAVQEILNWYHIKPADPPSLMTDFYDRLDYMLSPTGMMRRMVHLSPNWWKDAFGPMLAFTKDGGAVALIPRRFGGYGYADKESGKEIKITAETVNNLTEEAICFYRPLPLKALTNKELVTFMVQTLDHGDMLIFLLSALLAAFLGMITPMVTRLIFGTIIPLGNQSTLFSAGVLLIGTLSAMWMITLIRGLGWVRITQKIKLSVESASMGRLLNLPVSFFKEYNAGELEERISSLTQMCEILGDAVFISGMTGIFSVVYVLQIQRYAPELAPCAYVILLLQCVVMVLGIMLEIRKNRKHLKVSAKLNGLVFRLFSGIQKIKLTGAEQRAFSKWAEVYGKKASLMYNPSFFIKIQPALAGIITFGGSILLYTTAVKTQINQADYMAFISAYGLASGGLVSIASVVNVFSMLGPLLEHVEPIIKAVPENGGNKKNLLRMSGAVELANVSFRYHEDGPWIIDHMKLKINPGQYIGIVGKTGCGKSTLMRLLLGFETPVSGAVYYDNHDLQTLDLKSVRRKIGVVLQNSKLFAGDIYSNIVISAPWLDQNAAWKAAELAGVAEDIRKMPMGMQTMITEGSGGISGGQRQRIMIARAIASNPRILMFDEATSALDNITQKIVSDSLAELKCTRIVIAHRLSTIRQCDRIIVLDEGHIVEDGTYEELLKNNGFFSELVKRQTVL